MGRYVDYYCNDSEKELRELVDNITKKGTWGWIPQSEYDELYSLAAIILWNCEDKYDERTNVPFEAYLIGCICKRIATYVRNSNRKRRKARDKDGNILNDISLDQIMFKDDNGYVVLQDIPSDIDVEEIAINNVCGEYGDSVVEFIDGLHNTQKEIANMLCDGYSRNRIKDLLEIDDKAYSTNMKMIKSYKNKRSLYDLKKPSIDKEDMQMEQIENVGESYRNTSYSVISISKQLRKKKIRDDHILQRESGQWQKFAKSELISTILRGKSLTQVIIDEEYKNGVKMQWLIDGKQRCTILDDFLHDGFSISKNVKNHQIRYQTSVFDENGKEMRNEDGFPLIEYHDYDIRGKKFSELPIELREIIEDRQIPVLYNMNCTPKDIADDIARFNRSRPMNRAQSGWLGLEESFAELASKITKMKFFEVGFIGSSYTRNNHDMGVIRRIIVESIMVSDFIDDYKKDFGAICEYLTEEASDENFTEFYSIVERLEEVSDESVADIFNSKNSFLWFGLFTRFDRRNYRLNDTCFIRFANEFLKSLHEVKIDGISYDDLEEKASKDKSVVISKLSHLEQLMDIYFKSINIT